MFMESTHQNYTDKLCFFQYNCPQADWIWDQYMEMKQKRDCQVWTLITDKNK